MFLLAWAVLVVVFLAWYARTLRQDVTAALQLPARPVRPGRICRTGAAAQQPGGGCAGAACRFAGSGRRERYGDRIALRCNAGPRSACRPARNAARRQKRLWRFRVQEITVRDPLGLFAVPCAVPPQSRELCVLPPAEG